MRASCRGIESKCVSQCSRVAHQCRRPSALASKSFGVDKKTESCASCARGASSIDGWIEIDAPRVVCDRGGAVRGRDVGAACAERFVPRVDVRGPLDARAQGRGHGDGEFGAARGLQAEPGDRVVDAAGEGRGDVPEPVLRAEAVRERNLVSRVVVDVSVRDGHRAAHVADDESGGHAVLRARMVREDADELLPVGAAAAHGPRGIGPAARRERLGPRGTRHVTSRGAHTGGSWALSERLARAGGGRLGGKRDLPRRSGASGSSSTRTAR